MSATKPTSEVALCNMALDYLNEQPISSIDAPTSKTAELCARWYHQKRIATLREHPWNFASTRAALPAAVIDIPFGYETAYALPNDFVRLVSIGDDFNGVITNDSDELLIRYVYDLGNVSQFDPLFVEIFTLELAIAMASKLSRASDKKQELMDQLETVRSRAYAVDGQERPPSRISRSKWIARRRGGRSGSSTRGYGSPWMTFDDGVTSPVRYQVEDGYILIGEPL